MGTGEFTAGGWGGGVALRWTSIPSWWSGDMYTPPRASEFVIQHRELWHVFHIFQFFKISNINFLEINVAISHTPV